MAVMRLAIEIDSEVYPELHAGLAAVSRPEAREERLRQLAAAGLMWESVRMRGAAVTGPAPRSAPPQVPVLQDVVDITAWPATVAVDEPPASAETPMRRTGARSARLKRMNDRGLFKNG